MSLNQELKEGLAKVVIHMNDSRGFFQKISGRRYALATHETSSIETRFNILLESKKTTAKKQGTPIIAQIVNYNEEKKDPERWSGLTGFISPGERYSAIRDYIHSFSHQHYFILGDGLGHSLFTPYLEFW